ncbi:RNA 2'-phosphotransferase, partial [Salmonella enterica subsp. enterica serovar Dublin]|nr:RNA 2'-phosphotransferase [Salmonella enterica subsp. enterica serovar Dublin]
MWKRLCAGLSCRKFINPVTMTSVNKSRKSRDENEMAKYNEKELADTSKFLSFVLRHKPEAIGIVLDREGWADIDKLILCAQKAGKRLT